MDDRRTRSNVVDLLRYRHERAQIRRNSLDPAGPRRPALALVSRFRPLSAREIAHRQRMAEFLESQKSRVRSQKAGFSS